MNIQTKYDGLLEVDERDIWQFDKGVPGFPDEKKFYLYPISQDSLFYILQSTKTAQVAFVVTSPFHFFSDYEFILDSASLEALQLEDPLDSLTLVILTMGKTLEASTANLQAPIILNAKNKRGKQVILHDTDYHTKHLLITNGKKG